jgi:lipopolysaccharide transport system permease protein
MMGFFWTFVHPLTLLGVYTVLFSWILDIRFRAAGANTAGFTEYLFCGLFPWICIQESIQRSSTILLERASFIKQMIFPAHLLPVSVNLTALFHLAIAFMVFLVVVVYWGHTHPGFWIFLLPLVVFQWAITQGVSWMVAALAVYLRDVVQVVTLGLTVWMFLSPILYPLEMVPEGWKSVIWINPITYLVDSYRGIILEGRSPELSAWMTLGVTSLVLFTLGYWVFKRLKPGFSDVL